MKNQVSYSEILFILHLKKEKEVERFLEEHNEKQVLTLFTRELYHFPNQYVVSLLFERNPASYKNWNQLASWKSQENKVEAIIVD